MESPFPLFHEAYPPSGEREAYDASRHDAVAAKVPAELQTEWRKFGFGGYGDGLLWTVAPDKPVLDYEDWPGLDGTGIEVVRTAFASVCLWQGGRFLWLNVHSGKITTFNPRADVMFDSSLIEKNFRNSVLLYPLFHAARQRFGDIGPDECFGFAPLPALGGAIDKEFLIKTSMREYVALAGQVLRDHSKS
jgi:hypothetical protein